MAQKLIQDFQAETEQQQPQQRQSSTSGIDTSSSKKVDPFNPKPFQFEKPNSSDALKAAEEFDVFANSTSVEKGSEKTPSTTASSSKIPSTVNDTADSDMEDYKKDQEAMKKHWEEQKLARLGLTTTKTDTTKPATTTKSTVNDKIKTTQKIEQPTEITHSLTLPPAGSKSASPHSNDYNLSAETVPAFTTLPSNSILRHNPSKPFQPRELPVIFQWDSKYIPICKTKPLSDSEVWKSQDNNFTWLDEDPRSGTISYGDKTIKSELDRRLNTTPTNDDILSLIDSFGNEGGKNDDSDLTDVFDALNKKKKTIVDSENKTKRGELKNPISQQDFDVTRDHLGKLYFSAKTWTYEELYLHFLRFDQQTIFAMKTAMEYFLRLEVPSDFKDLKLKPGVVYTRLDESEFQTIDEKRVGPKRGQTTPQISSVQPEFVNSDDDDDDNNDKDVHSGLSVTENEQTAKQEKLGDEDKFFARIALRRQKLISRYQLPALYRYIHERINDIQPPHVVAGLFQKQKIPLKNAAKIQPPQQQPRQQQSGANSSVQQLTQEEQQVLMRYRQQQLLQHQQQQARSQRGDISADREPNEQELQALRYAHYQQQQIRQQQQQLLAQQQRQGGAAPSQPQPQQRTASQPPQQSKNGKK